MATSSSLVSVMSTSVIKPIARERRVSASHASADLLERVSADHLAIDEALPSLGLDASVMSAESVSLLLVAPSVVIGLVSLVTETASAVSALPLLVRLEVSGEKDPLSLENVMASGESVSLLPVAPSAVIGLVFLATEMESAVSALPLLVMLEATAEKDQLSLASVEASAPSDVRVERLSARSVASISLERADVELITSSGQAIASIILMLRATSRDVNLALQRYRSSARRIKNKLSAIYEEKTSCSLGFARAIGSTSAYAGQ